MRALLLWCAQNAWLSENVPRWGFVRRAVKRFMPGDEFDSALKAAVTFKAQGIGAVFTKLGENIKALSEAAAAVEHYEMVLSTAAEAGLEPEISVKPTQVGLDIDPDAAFANLNRLAVAAARAKGFLWIDMEGSAYTDRTLDLYNRIHARQPAVGVCLQAYLYRTASDAYRMLAFKPAIRLVKGAYAEPADRAFPAKRDVDANYLALCALMLPDVNRGRLRLVLGTHDVALIDRIARLADAIGMDRHQLELHMLYGIQSSQQVRLATEGYRVSALIAYGDAWYAWYLRRLAERPANVLFVARQMFG
ncbi:MAG TPA: proline dehydrogenase family protein [Candidatus Dormibacteraeota bacterium]